MLNNIQILTIIAILAILILFYLSAMNKRNERERQLKAIQKKLRKKELEAKRKSLSDNDSNPDFNGVDKQ